MAGSFLGIAAVAYFFGSGTLALGEEWMWKQVSSSGTLPPARRGHSAVLDQGTGNMLVFGGFGGSDGGGSYLSDAWELATGAQPGEPWAQVAPSGAWDSARDGHSAVLVPSAGKMLLFGGSNRSGALDDLWALAVSGRSWAQVPASGSGPPARTIHSAVFVNSTGKMIICGGVDERGYKLDDLWSFSWGSQSWSRTTASGAWPVARWMHSAVYLPSSDTMLVFGGSSMSDYYVKELWAFSFAEDLWSLIPESGTWPPARLGHAAVYDGAAGMLVFGGRAHSGRLDDLWRFAWVGQAWSQITPSGATPPARDSHSAVFSEATGEMLVFGGDNHGGAYLNDLWALSLGLDADLAAVSKISKQVLLLLLLLAVFS